jgi:hypothetical protein
MQQQITKRTSGQRAFLCLLLKKKEPVLSLCEIHQLFVVVPPFLCLHSGGHKTNLTLTGAKSRFLHCKASPHLLEPLSSALATIEFHLGHCEEEGIFFYQIAPRLEQERERES